MAVVDLSRDGAVLTITLNRASVLNALNAEVHAALARRARPGGARRDIRAVVLTGAGRGFCVGQDLEEFRERRGRRRATGCASATTRSCLGLRSSRSR